MCRHILALMKEPLLPALLQPPAACPPANRWNAAQLCALPPAVPAVIDGAEDSALIRGEEEDVIDVQDDSLHVLDDDVNVVDDVVDVVDDFVQVVDIDEAAPAAAHNPVGWAGEMGAGSAAPRGGRRQASTSGRQARQAPIVAAANAGLDTVMQSVGVLANSIGALFVGPHHGAQGQTR